MTLRGLTGFVFSNWPLRLGAIALAIVLYLGLVVLQNARVWTGPVPIEPVNQSSTVYLLAGLGDVSSIRYVAPVDVAQQVTAASFLATADLGAVNSTAAGSTVNVPVEVKALDARIQVVGWQPTIVVARVDPVQVRDGVPVRVDHGTVPAGLRLGDTTVDPVSVTVSGAASIVSRVAATLARVSVDASGINVDAEVDLVAIDNRDEIVAPVDISPATVHVRIPVTEQLLDRTVPVIPTITGSLAPGYSVRDVTVTPATVTVSGTAAAIGTLASVQTAGLDLTGRTADVTSTLNLQLPVGISAAGGSRVQVRVRVLAQTGSRSFGAGVVVTGARSDRTYALSVPDVLVTLGGTQSGLDAIDPAALFVMADVSGLDVGSYTIPVRFALPAGTELDAISPTDVIVTIAAPPTPSPSPSPSPGP